MNMDSKRLQALLDPLGLDESVNLLFVRISRGVTLAILFVEALIEVAFPLLVIIQLLR